MNSQRNNPPLRRGQFLWRDPVAQRAYIRQLKERISRGYYDSDRIFTKVADELAPILEEMASGSL